MESEALAFLVIVLTFLSVLLLIVGLITHNLPVIVLSLASACVGTFALWLTV